MLSRVTASSGVDVQERTLNFGAEGIAGGVNNLLGNWRSVRQEHLNCLGRVCAIVRLISGFEDVEFPADIVDF